MALLKKGSKGKPVEDLQTTLNKLGAKPELKVDGIFGPLTDKALRQAQKRLKIPTVDGKAGDHTLAALKYGKPLPKMEVPDVEKSLLAFEGAYRDIQKTEQQMKAIQEGIKAINKATVSLTTTLGVATGSDLETWARAIERQRKIHEVQQKFAKVLVKNPAEAAKLAKEAERLDSLVSSEAQSLARSATGVVQLVSDARKALGAAANEVGATAMDVEKRYGATLKKIK